MTVRALLVVIDDERPLGPQLAGARLWGIPWKLLRQLAGGFTTRHLQNLYACSSICERQSVQWSVTVRPFNAQGTIGEDDVMAGLAQMIIGGGGSPPVIIQQSNPGPQPTPPTADDPAAEAAARKEKSIMQQSVGRSATMLTDYALASQAPDTLKKTLGGA